MRFTRRLCYRGGMSNTPPNLTVCATRLANALVCAMDSALEAQGLPNRSQFLDRAVRRLLGWPDQGLHPDYTPGPNGHTVQCQCPMCPGDTPRKARRRRRTAARLVAAGIAPASALDPTPPTE